MSSSISVTFPNAISFSPSQEDFESTTESTTKYDPISPCPRTVVELGMGIFSGILIVLSNVICIKLLSENKLKQHQENLYYVINLGVSNIICGSAILGANILQINYKENSTESYLDSCYRTCLVWGPVYIFCIMLPYVTLSTLGIDIARYCHLSLNYQRETTTLKHCISIASGWIYTFAIVFVSAVSKPEILCDKKHWELNIFIIIFPILLMFIPAVCVVIIFVYVMRKYWTSNRKITKSLKGTRISGVGADATKIRLVGKFSQRFSHLIIFSILCSVVYTSITISEAIIETNSHQRLCVLFRIERVFIALNSLLTPWMHCLSTKELRAKISRKYFARWRSNSFHQSLTARRRSHTTRSNSLGNNSAVRHSLIRGLLRSRQNTVDVAFVAHRARARDARTHRNAKSLTCVELKSLSKSAAEIV